MNRTYLCTQSFSKIFLERRRLPCHAQLPKNWSKESKFAPNTPPGPTWRPQGFHRSNGLDFMDKKLAKEVFFRSFEVKTVERVVAPTTTVKMVKCGTNLEERCSLVQRWSDIEVILIVR